MVVGVDSTPLNNPSSGGGRYALNILRHIVSEGDVHLQFYGRRPAPRVMEEFSNVPFFEQNVGNTWWYAVVLPSLLKQNGCQSYYGFPLPLVKITGIKYVTSVLDLYLVHLPRVEQWSMGRRLRTLLGRTVAYWVTSRSVHVADHIFVISKATGKDLTQYFNISQWELAPPAPDILPGGTQRLEDVDVPYILAVGGYQGFRNRERLIEAYATWVSRYNRGGDLVIVGNFQDNQQHEHFKALCHSWGVDHRVKFITDCDDKQLADLYRRSKGLIHPTLCEGFGMPIVEALAFGKPIVVSTAGAVPEVSAGFELQRFDPFQVEQISRAIATLFESSLESMGIVSARQEYAGTFSWETSGQATARIVKSSIQNKP